MGNMRLLAGAGPYSLTFTWYVSGTATDVGDVTIGAVDANGDTVVAAATATTNNGDGTYSYSLASQSEPNLLTITWTRTDTSAALSQTVEVVGSLLVDEATARGWGVKADSTNKPLSSASEYPDATIAAEIDRVTDDLENWTHRSWIQRYCRVELPGTGGECLYLDEGRPMTSTGLALHRPGRAYDISQVISATVGGTSVTVSDITIDPIQSALILESGEWTLPTVAAPRNVVVEYVYGLPAPVDGSDRIALDLLVDRLVPSAIPDRATSWDTDFGTVRVVTEGGPMGNKTRLPHVNQWISAHENLSVVGGFV